MVIRSILSVKSCLIRTLVRCFRGLLVCVGWSFSLVACACVSVYVHYVRFICFFPKAPVRTRGTFLAVERTHGQTHTRHTDRRTHDTRTHAYITYMYTRSDRQKTRAYTRYIPRCHLHTRRVVRISFNPLHTGTHTFSLLI